MGCALVTARHRSSRDLAATGRARAILVCPQGFVADHLEVAYDLDIEAARVAAEVGLTFARTRTLNDDPTVMAAGPQRDLAAAPDGAGGALLAWEDLRDAGGTASDSASRATRRG